MWLVVITIALICALSAESVPSIAQTWSSEPSFGLSSIKRKVSGSAALGNFAQEDAINYRLPNDSIPLRYDLWLKTDVDKENFDFSGRVNIHIRIVKETKLITLHQRQITIKKINLLNTDKSLKQSKLFFSTDMENDFLTVMLPRLYEVNEEFILNITYNGMLRTDGSGFYRASYLDEDNKRVWFATTQFEMTDARHAMPCYDEPGIRAVISLEIHHDKSYHAISNMPIIERLPVGTSDYVRSRFEDTPVMQSYLLAFVVSKYDFISSRDGAVEQRVFAKPQSIQAGEANFTLSVVGPILKQLEEHLNVSYPLTKMDHVLITDFIWSAMENFGMTTYQESRMLYNEGVDSSDKALSIIELVAHEYAHQWFGNIVAPKWWSYVWLNEGFATLFEYFIPNLIWPELNSMERFKALSRSAAFEADLLRNDSKPLNYYVESPDNIRRKFDAISYNKGASVLWMFQEALTEPTFTKGLTYYLNEMKFKAATPADLHRNLQKAYDEDFPSNLVDIGAAMTTWEDQAGYPVINVQRTGGSVIFNQKRFGGGFETYAIPISYSTKENVDLDRKPPNLWLTTRSYEMKLDGGDWVILNVHQTGYYKVHYDKFSWDAIISGLENDRDLITPFYRCQMFKEMNDKPGDVINVPQALGMLETLTNDTAPSVWMCASRSIESIFWMRLDGTDLAENYYKFIRKIIKPHVDRFENITIYPTAADREMRNLINAYNCLTNDEDCLEEQLERLLDQIESSEIPESYCLGMLSANETVFQILLDNMLETQNRAAQIRSLGCSRDPVILGAYLAVSINTTNNLTVDERKNILIYTTHVNVIGLHAVLDFTLENHDAIKKVIGDKIQDVILNAAALIKTTAQKKMLEKIVAKVPVDGALDKAEANLLWYNAHHDEISLTLGSNSLFASLSLIVVSAIMKFVL